MSSISGQMRSLHVKDTEASKDLIIRPKALTGVKGSIGAPMPGEILEISVKEGQKVEAKQLLFVLSAMKVRFEKFS